MSSRILFLYSRLPNHFLNCVEEYTSLYNANALIICQHPDINAPYKISHSKRVEIIYKKDLSKKIVNDLCYEKFNAICFASSVWFDFKLRKVVSCHKGKIPTIVFSDNIWVGSLKQHIGAFLSPFFLHRLFSHCWIPGKSQSLFALKMGFSDNNIIFNMLSANTNFFKKFGDSPVTNFNRRIVYAGRFVKYKRPDWLLAAYKKLSKKTRESWRLEFVGSGELRDELEKNKCPGVSVHDFMQPQDLGPYLRLGGIFSLPSINEHWGVAIHEATCSGLPLLLSDSCGAASDLLINKYNGFTFKTHSFESFFSRLEYMTGLSDEELFLMSKNSSELSKKISPEIWAASLHSVI